MRVQGLGHLSKVMQNGIKFGVCQGRRFTTGKPQNEINIVNTKIKALEENTALEFSDVFSRLEVIESKQKEEDQRRLIQELEENSRLPREIVYGFWGIVIGVVVSNVLKSQKD